MDEDTKREIEKMHFEFGKNKIIPKLVKNKFKIKTLMKYKGYNGYMQGN